MLCYFEFIHFYFLSNHIIYSFILSFSLKLSPKIELNHAVLGRFPIICNRPCFLVQHVYISACTHNIMHNTCIQVYRFPGNTVGIVCEIIHRFNVPDTVRTV